MPSQTNFAKLYLYNDSTDKEKKFIEFRSNLCGTAEDSNMNKIDNLLSSQNTSISNINTKLNQIFVQDESGNNVVNASSLNLKGDTYFENVAGTYNAICAYSSNIYTLTLANTNINISENIFTLRFAAPNSYQENSSFVFGGITYTPVDPAFETGQVVLINFDKSTSKCYFSSGSGKGTADGITIVAIPGISSGNVQGALEEIMTAINGHTSNINSTNTRIDGIINGTTTVGNASHAGTADTATSAGDASALSGKDLSYVMNYNNLTNKPAESGVIITSTAPDVSRTTMLWIDLGNSAVLKYSDGTQWLPVGSVWK